MPNIYSPQTIAHFRKPHNFGQLPHPDGLGEAGNIICGDIMSLYIEVGKNKKGKEIITAVKFKTYGCAAAIATSSVITDLAKGKTIKEALLLSKKDIIDILHGLPPIKIHCSLLAIDALGEAIYQYLYTRQRPIPEDLTKRHGHIEQEKKIIEERIKKLKTTL
jgi:nitrogen fixation NifU-like protein